MAMTAAWVPIPRASLSGETLERLRRAVLDGGLEEGTALPEAATAARLGVSRVPVREALVALEREGLVEFDAHGRAAVRRFTDEDLREILSLRSSLQTLAARRAAETATEGDLQRLGELLRRTRAARDLSELSALDSKFHDAVVAIARHRRLSRVWEELRPQMELWLARLHRKRERVKHDVRDATVRAHAKFVAVLRKRRPEEAAALMEKHCRSWDREFPELV
jgi:GntR family transcriptional regulator of gluconate operon